MICLMAMVVSANAQNVSYKNGNVAIETYIVHNYASYYQLNMLSEWEKKGYILIPIERLDEFVSLLEKSVTLFEKYERVVEGLDIHNGDSTKVKLKGLNFKTIARIPIALVEGKLSQYNVNFEFYCDTWGKTPYFFLSSKYAGYEIKLKFKSKYDILKLIKVLDKDSFTVLANEEKRKEELLKIKQQEEENRKKQVESALQQAFN